MTEAGLYCESGGFHIDPHRGVKTAIVTHAHSDHARKGSEHYFCAERSVELLRLRLGERIRVTGVPYGQVLRLGETKVSLHPAGHILGSAQVRIERRGEVWVASGDYKRETDPTCEPFEVLTCDTFITESTFDHPSYEWTDTEAEIAALYEWWQEGRRAGKNCLLACYAVGKTQRVLSELRKHTTARVLLDGEANRITRAYRELGVEMVLTEDLASVAAPEKLNGELIISATANTEWTEKIPNIETAFASGWMKTGAFGTRRRYDRGFTISDHSDWASLLRTVEETRAQRVLVLQKNEGPLIRHLRRRGIDAQAFHIRSAARGVVRPPLPVQTEFPF